MSQNLSAQFVCPSPKVWDIIEKRLHRASVHSPWQAPRFAFKQHYLIGKGKLEETYDAMSNGHINDPKTSPNVGFDTFVPKAVFALQSGSIRSIFKS